MGNHKKKSALIFQCHDYPLVILRKYSSKRVKTHFGLLYLLARGKVFTPCLYTQQFLHALAYG